MGRGRRYVLGHERRGEGKRGGREGKGKGKEGRKGEGKGGRVVLRPQKKHQ